MRSTTNLSKSYEPHQTILDTLNKIHAICERLSEKLDDRNQAVPRVWFTNKQAASYLHVHFVTLAKLRSKGAGPRFFSRNRRVRYHVRDLDSYVRGESCQQEVGNDKC
jgi:hypothetical protein